MLTALSQITETDLQQILGGTYTLNSRPSSSLRYKPQQVKPKKKQQTTYETVI